MLWGFGAMIHYNGIGPLWTIYIPGGYRLIEVTLLTVAQCGLQWAYDNDI